MVKVGRVKFSLTTVLVCVFALFMAQATPKPAAASTGAALSLVPSAGLVGKGRLTYLGFNVFDAELYAPSGTYSPSKPFALKLTYLRNFKGSAIADQSAKEIRRQGGVSEAKLRDWTKQMRSIFPAVSKGQSITGVRTAAGGTQFYYGSRRIGQISDPTFTKRFFAIWLGSQTRNPQLRARLVGSGR